MIGAFHTYISAISSSILAIELKHIKLIGFAESLKSFLAKLSLKVHAGHAHHAVPEVIIVGLAQISHQTVCRI